MRVKVELKTPSSLENVFLNIHQWCSCSATKAEIVGLFPGEQRKPKIVSTRAKLTKAQTAKQN